MIQRYRLDVAYRGGAFHGSAFTRAGALTVAGALTSAALGLVGAGSAPTVLLASRTDAGVHALHNVAQLDLVRGGGRAPFTGDALAAALSARLSSRGAPGAGHITVLRCAAQPESWRASSGVAFKTYIYRVAYPSRVPPTSSGASSRAQHCAAPLLADAPPAAWARAPLDVTAMRVAAAALVGRHDFSSLRAVGCAARSPVRCLYQVDICEDGDGEACSEAHAVWRRAALRAAPPPPLPLPEEQSALLAMVPAARATDFFAAARAPLIRAPPAWRLGPTHESLSIVVRGDAFLYRMVGANGS